MENEDALEILNNLIETCKDGEHGFKTAAEALKNPDLRRLCLERSNERAQFAGELQAKARELSGEEPEESGSASGAMHRGWMTLKAAITGGSDNAIISECERGED